MPKRIGYIISAIALIILFPLTTFKSQSTPIISSQQISQDLIIGQWRGYREIRAFKLYFGYEFFANKTFLARHRIYQQDKTIKDEFWQGNWDFSGEILTLEGVSKTDAKNSFKLSFRLDNDLTLTQAAGTLSNWELPQRLGKPKQE